MTFVSATPVPSLGSGRAIATVLAFRRSPIEFLRSHLAELGSIYEFRLLGIPIVLVNHPDHVRHILVDQADAYGKDVVLFKIVRPVLRNGLIGNADLELWRRQRKMMAPHFTPRTIARFARYMTGETQATIEGWERERRLGDVVDMTDEVGQLALRIVNRSLFSAAVGPRAQEFERAFAEANQILGAFFRFPFPPLRFPTPSHNRLRRAIERMDEFVSEFVHARIAGDMTDDADDLLSLLLNSVDEGGGMDLEQLHHEVLNICIGAFETTTNTLSWALYLLARHPAVEAELHDEVDRVLAGRTPGVDDLPALRYTRSVIDETLRLYSPAYQFMRRSHVDDVVGGYALPAGTNVLFNSYLLHRHPDFWPDAEAFDPHRFDPDAEQTRPKHAYIPFGSGPRVCIGKHFALMELTLVLATLTGRYRFTMPPGAAEVDVDALITLHPRGGVHLRLERRAVGGR